MNRTVSCGALCFLLSVAAFGQVNAVLGGTVADASGAVIPDAKVTATNTGTGIVTSRDTNSTGNYDFPSLQPGKYTVSAAVAGFQTLTFRDLDLGQGQQVRQNFNLQIASAATSIEVIEEADSTIGTTTNSVGAVLTERSVLTLPVLSRNVLDLASTSPGVVVLRNAFGAEVPNFSGAGTGQVNTTRDGITTNDGRYNDSNGAYSAIFTSPDMVEEVRVSTNSVDPAAGRGVAQVQMRTRSGTNAYHGSLFYTNNNSALSANDWFSNLRGAQKSYTNRNQYGGRLGGAIVKNKAFFFVLIDNQRYVEKVLTTSTVLTESARNGVFRYLTSGSPGGTSRRNANALQASSSVDLNGNIATRDQTTGAPLFLNQFNVFTDVRDTNRNKPDAGWFSQYLSRLPLPNDYTVGDGLNTAGYRWYRRQYGVDGATGQSANPNRDHLTTRFDYQINDSNKLSFTMTREKDFGVTAQAGLPDYPGGYFGEVVRKPDFYTIQWTKTISSTLLNEFRFGQKRDTWQGLDAFDKGCCFGGNSETNLTQEAKDARAAFPTTPDGNLLYVAATPAGATGLGLGTFANFNVSTPRLTYSPLRNFADTLTWNHGAHSFQFGGELNRFYSQGINGGGQQTTRPFLSLGIGSVPIPGISSAAFAGLNSNDVTPAQNLLSSLAGSVGNIQQQYFVNSPTAKNWTDYKTSILFTREHHQNDWSFYAKDSWKTSKNLTLNMGVRYDKYGVPYDSLGLGGRFTGGQSGLFGISGTNFANAQWAPYANGGSLSTTEFVGKFSPQPNKLIFGNDWNNFAPSFGFSYNVPWLKKSTVVRGGYGINYAGAADFLGYSTNIANLPGFNLNVNTAPTGYVNLSNATAALNQSAALAAASNPFSPVALDSTRSTGITGYTDDRVVPYIQSFNFSIQHEIAHNLTLDVGWVGNKATKLYSNTQINESNIFENGILDAFNVTRRGGNAPLFDRMFQGLNFGGTIGVVNGTTVTGSQALRQYVNTNQFIANGDVGGLANYINTTNQLTGSNGGILRNGKLPENFIVANPQFGSVNLAGNNTNSTYHSLQTSVTKRYSTGFSGQFSYVFSKNLGSDVLRDPRNRQLSKTILGNNRTHIIKFTGTWDLPFGSKGFIARNVKWADKIIGGWQLAPVIQWTSGAPMSFTSAFGTMGSRVSNTPDIVGTLPNGAVRRDPNGFVEYFTGYTTKALVPTYGADQTTLAGRYTGQSLLDPQGNVVLQNPNPGFTGNASTNLPGLVGPSQGGYDISLSKKIPIGEGKFFTFRADAIDALNHPIWANPGTNLNATGFGRITAAGGNRTVTLNMRFDF